MRSDSFFLEDGGRFWVLHVFDVPGEDDVLAVTLNIKSAEAYPGFQREFSQCLELVRGSHPDGPLCEACRPRAGLNWLSSFSDWLKAAYAAMGDPPSPVDDVPDVVRLSFESMVMASSQGDADGGGPLLS